MPPFKVSRSRRQTLRALGVRSGLEEALTAQLEGAGVPFKYEGLKLEYRVEETRKYTPDYCLLHNGIIVEGKGRFTTQDRKKMKLIREQWPTLDIRIVFSNSNTRISKQSKTTYAKWAVTHGFLYADRTIPDAWINEPVNQESLRVIRGILKEKTT